MRLKLESFDEDLRQGLRYFAEDVLGDERVLDDLSPGAPERWAWLWFQLGAVYENERWFPQGRDATTKRLYDLLREESDEEMAEFTFVGYIAKVSEEMRLREEQEKTAEKVRQLEAARQARIAAAAPALCEAVQLFLSRGHHDTCSYSKCEDYECDCGFAKGLAVLAKIDD